MMCADKNGHYKNKCKNNAALRCILPHNEADNILQKTMYWNINPQQHTQRIVSTMMDYFLLFSGFLLNFSCTLNIK